MQSNKPFFKVVTLGDSGVGKSCLLNVLLGKGYYETEITCISQETVNINIKGNDVIIDYWDTAGQERFYAITKSFLTKVNVALICFEANRRDTFLKTELFIKNLLDVTPNAKLVLVQCKNDISGSNVTEAEINEMCEKV